MKMATPKELDAVVKAASTAKGAELAKLAERVLELQTADKFLMASALLNAGQVELAETIGRRACDEIALANLLWKK